MGACLSRNSGSDNDFRNLNDSRHVMLLLAKKERKRDRAMRRSISLSGHADTDTNAGHPAAFATQGTTTSSSPRASMTTTTTTTATPWNSNNNSQTSITASVLERSDSGRQRSKRSLMQLASGPHRAPSARQNLLDTQKELAKLDSYGEYVPPTAPPPTTAIGEEGPGAEAAAAECQQAKAA